MTSLLVHFCSAPLACFVDALDRIFVPVPSELEPAFRVTDSAKDYYVRFDSIP